MRITIDTEKRLLIEQSEHQLIERPLYSKEAFEIISELWVKVGWNEKYSYTFSWMGRPVIQLPEDMIRIQEVIYELKPDVIVETGVAHGGSLIFYATLCKAMNQGRIIGVDIEIRPNNRKEIESHELASYISLVEGDSVQEATLSQVKSLIKNGEKILVVLDSNHSKDHVAKELEAYHELVSEGSYIVVTDGIMKDLYDTPRGEGDWKQDNPVSAVEEFLEKYPQYQLSQPSWPFNESELTENITHWPSSWLKKGKME
ncbi:cephalosporin hydroxylase family protein [Paenibacillus whitsoniae]|uniref:Hydroxylase n=1 Tax=Paenibacillus whitsoniae TaxID=2496558 RepID=A0A3S0C9D7_9BACL|nr:CmcI family methyltransferase [Paenibacillus whitsoniae]RTE07915.1 hydroxylase [Paenibacillus whitsoniae]